VIVNELVPVFILTALLIGISIGLFFYEKSENQQIKNNLCIVTGEIIDKRKGSKSTGKSVRVRFLVKGNTYYGYPDVSSEFFDNNQVGSIVRIYYDTLTPSRMSLHLDN
jgi:hypothetical protein